MYPIAPSSTLQAMGQYNDVECTLAMCVLYDTAKHVCDHNVINRNEIWQKKRRHITPVSRFVIEHITESVPVCDAASRVTEVMVAELTIYAAANVAELFVQTLVVL